MSRIGLPAGVIRERQRNQPFGFAGLDGDAALQANVKIRQGQPADLANIVLGDGELALERDSAGNPAWLRVGNGVTPGGVDLPRRLVQYRSTGQQPSAAGVYEVVPDLPEVTLPPGVYRYIVRIFALLTTNEAHVTATGKYQGIGFEIQRRVQDEPEIWGVGGAALNGSVSLASVDPITDSTVTAPVLLPFPYVKDGQYSTAYEVFAPRVQLNFTLISSLDIPTTQRFRFAWLNKDFNRPGAFTPDIRVLIEKVF
jgi:hypothetical protein